MKKSLIALAVLAASGASFAQVSITGNLTYGFQSTTTGGSAGLNSQEQSGFGAETANVVFTANEDLGGGFAAKASLKINSTPFGAATGDDHTLTLVTPVGGLTMGTVKGADYLGGGIAGVGAYYAGWDSAAVAVNPAIPATAVMNAAQRNGNDKLFTNRTTRDFVSFTIPVGAFTFAVAQHEGAGSVAFGSGASGGTTAGQYTSTGAAINGGSTAPVTTLSATYAAGPLVANGQYAIYKNSVGYGNTKDTTRLSGSYDLGMAKLGAGVVITNHDNTNFANLSPKTTDYLVGAKVPMGASSFGLTFASRTYADMFTTSNSYTGTGYSLEYGYAMSKRTSVIANYARWTAPTNAVSQDASNQYQLLLAHTF